MHNINNQGKTNASLIKPQYGFSFSQIFTVISFVKSQGTSNWLERNINKTKVITSNERKEVKCLSNSTCWKL